MSHAKHQHICPGCFRDKGESDVCPLCGFDESKRPNPIVLPYWSLLNRQYLTGRVLGKLGGFGITYLAWDTRLDIPAAIKEYLPRDFAARDSTCTSVTPHSGEDEKMFRYGLKLFLSEAKTLAKFDHPNIVRVRNVFESNGTAYLVMDYLEGESLQEYLHRKSEPMDEALALEIMLPVLDGLEEVHRAGFLHRDIKPHNLYLSVSGRTILLDFGAARQAIGEGGRSQSVILTPGYAPFEQYHRRGHQGPWTDIYASAAVLYRMVTGTAPPESTERVDEDHLSDPREFNPHLSPTFANALLQGLALQPKQRPQSVADFRSLLSGTVAPGVPADQEGWQVGADKATAAPPNLETLQPPNITIPPFQPAIGGVLKTGIGVVVVAVLAVAYYLHKQAGDRPAEMSMRSAERSSPSLMPSLPEPGVKAPTKPIDIPVAGVSADNAASACAYCPELVRIRGGDFWMGARDGDPDAREDEKPRHKVRVDDFELGKYEVTQGQWRQLMGNNPSLFSVCGDDCPVENVSWHEVQAFISKLNQKTGQHCRLPTEAEWEYACRNGGQDLRYCGGNDLDSLAWYEDNAKKPHPVGGKKPNALGLYDMSGNVWEWTSSVYQSYPYQANDGRERYQAGGEARVLRGGFWGQHQDSARASARSLSPPDLRNFDLGFRVACTPTD